MSDAHKALVRLAVTVIGVAALCLICADSTLAQCAMCRASIGSNSLFARNLNIGVLVLLAPPVTMFCAIFVVAYRYRKSA